MPSLLTDPTGIPLIHSYPECVSVLEEDVRRKDQLTSKDVVPHILSGLHDWAYISKDYYSTDQHQHYMMLYKSPHLGLPTTDEVVEVVTIRMQGVLGRHRLSVWGNWKGDPQQCVKATQYLNLLSGPFDPQWKIAIERLNNISSFVRRNLSARSTQPPLDPTKSVFFQRKVFVKSECISEDIEVQTATPEMDIHGFARNIPEGWVLTQGVKIGQKESNGSVSLVKHSGVLGEGDFIDVCFSIDIRMEGHGAVKVVFEPYNVVQLLPKEQFDTMLLKQGVNTGQRYDGKDLRPLKRKKFIKAGVAFDERM